MSHDFHTGPEDAILYDGCEECDRRAAKPLDALLNLDALNYEKLRDRMVAVEYGPDRQSYLTTNEAKVGQTLYLISILEERHGRVR